MQYKAETEVVEPEILRECVTNEIAEMKKMYEI